jgi:D-alanyl-D-alanine carboxypeptidase
MEDNRSLPLRCSAALRALHSVPRPIHADVPWSSESRLTVTIRPIARLLPIFCALALLSCGDGTDRNAELAARVDARVARYQRDTYAPGVSVAVVRAGRDTLVYRGYGLANLEHDVPATPRTVYRIGSVTKQFTAAAVLRLAEQGRLSLDDSVGRHLPRLPAAWRGARIRQVLNHTSGIPASIAGAVREWDRMTPELLVPLLANEPLDFAPGAEFRYSNLGYIVLGLLIEEVAGTTYAHHVESTLLRPLGLHATRYCDVEPVIEHRASGYDAHDTVLVNAAYNPMRIPFSAGALCSTVGDLAAWNRALATGRVVNPASWARMTTPEGAARSSGYGYGLFVRPIGGRPSFGHGGAVEGFRAINAYLPDDSLSVTLLTNLGRDGPEAIVGDVVLAALQASSTRGAGR